MRKPGVDPNNVQMSDVLCDFCHREWTENAIMLEGHQGSCICGNCLTMACVELADSALLDFYCTMCRENNEDRAALNRAGEVGWQSPAVDATICKRCIELAAGALEKDPDYNWTRPSD